MKKLHDRFGDAVQFVDVIVRQAHPGPGVPPYHRFEQKMHDAIRYQRHEAIPWPVLVDDLRGTTHQVYGGMADPTYLIDVDGRVAYYDMWTHAPSLYRAIDALLAQSGRGVVEGGVKRSVRMGASLTDGWRGLRRGLPQSFTDLMWATPGSPILPWLGFQLRPLLAPLTLRGKPLPAAAKASLLLGAGALAGLGLLWLSKSQRRSQ